MKTQTTTQKTRIIVTLIGMFFILCLLSVTANAQLIEQNKKTAFGLSLESQVTANGYGATTLPGLYLKQGRRAYTLSATVQNRKLNMSGFQFSYAYSVTGLEATGNCNELELYFFTSAAYHYNAIMGRHTLKEEVLTNRTANENSVGDLRFKSAELYAGVGIKVNLAKNLKWISSIGVGGYTSFDFPDHQKLFYDAKNAGLLLRTGIKYEIK